MVGRDVPLEIVETRPGRRSSTGPCPASGTSAGPGSSDPTERRVVDFADSNLHVLNYSAPIDATVLARRAARAPVHPPRRPGLDPVPDLLLRERWGFCMSAAAARRARADGDYEVCIDSTLGDGAVTYGEALLPGETRRRGPAHDLRLPPLARERQPLRRRVVAVLGTNARAPAVAPLLVPPALGPGRSARSAGSRGTATRRAHPPRPRRLVRRRPGPVDVQAKPPRRRRDRSAVAHVLRAEPRTASSTGSLRRRRAPVRLAGVRPACRRALADARRPVPRIPLVRRRPRPRPARVPRRRASPPLDVIDAIERNGRTST